MFEKIKTLIAKPQLKPTETHPSFITDKEKIILILKAVAAKRLICQLILPQDETKTKPSQASEPASTPTIPMTYIYKVGTERIALEKLIDNNQHEMLLATDSFKVLIDVNGSPFSFPASILDTKTENNKTFYIIEMPDKVHYPCQRENRRVKIGALNKTPIYVKLELIKLSLPCVIDEIGPQGMALVLPNKGVRLPHIGRRDILKSCSINCNFGNAKFDLQVSDAREIDGTVSLNCKFVNITKEMLDIVNAIMENSKQISI